MNRQEEISRHSAVLLLLGLCLLGLVWFTPDAGKLHGSNFFKMAGATSWKQLFDLPAAWCSIKIIIFSIGLCLAIESVGTFLALLKLKRMAALVFCLQAVAVLGLLAGGYYLVKSLL